MTGSDAQCVEISIAEDPANLGKIKVRTDDDIVYAVPASCNVDVVFAIPTNSAACECTGNDATTSSIHQMARACREFIKDHFFNTRGVYMSLIPYSGKLSISPDRLQDWSIAFPKYTVDPGQIFLMSACLYSTTGLKDAALSQELYDWGNAQSGYPIMFRAGVAQVDAKYNNNPYFTGFLFDSSEPSTGDSYKYLRQNLNPCRLEHANLEQGLCTNDCPKYLANPYYMIEPTADVTKIYEMLAALLPFSDPHNVSNFIFPVFEWVNNFFQGWTRDPGRNATSGGSDSETAQLGSQSKTTKNRKKAIILLVNKPDWFEPREMTYLGLYNDYQEVHAHSDMIDFGRDFSDSSNLFVDGTRYDGRILSPKKILQFIAPPEVQKANTNDDHYYGCAGTASCCFACTKKQLIKIVIEPFSSEKVGRIKFTNLKQSGEGNIENDKNYWIESRRAIYVEAEQLQDDPESDGRYYVNFDINGIRFISAEITDKMYRKYALRGTTSGTGTAIIKTSTLDPIELEVEAVGRAVVNIEETEYDITDQDGSATIRQSVQGGQKISCQNAEISSVHCDGNGDTEISLGGAINSYDDTPGYVLLKGEISEDLEFTVSSQLPLLTVGTAVIYCSNTIHNPENIRFIFNSNEPIAPSYASSKQVECPFNLGSPMKKLTIQLNEASMSFGAVNSSRIYCTGKYSASLSPNSDGSFSVPNIGANATATVTVEVIANYLKYKKCDGTIDTLYFRPGYPETIIIDPNHYEYELQDDGSYLVKLDTYNLEFSNSRVVEWLYAFELDERTAREGCGNAVLINARGIENPVIAAQEMSKSNLKNLKDIYGDNIKIYLIKYKPEKTYRIGADERDFSYEYLDACASEVYKAENVEELKAKFETIWEDLLEWTGYQEAKVVN